MDLSSWFLHQANTDNPVIIYIQFRQQKIQYNTWVNRYLINFIAFMVKCINTCTTIADWYLGCVFVDHSDCSKLSVIDKPYKIFLSVREGDLSHQKGILLRETLKNLI